MSAMAGDLSEPRWSDAERRLLLVPLVASAVAVVTFVAPEAFATVAGYSGDPYIFRLGAAATLGYTVALVAGLRDGHRSALRHVVVAGLAFSALVILAVLIEPLRGRPLQPIAAALGVTAIATLLIYAILVRTAAATGGPAAPRWIVGLLWFATAAALFFGIAPLLPRLFIWAFGYADTAAFTFRMAGAATAGYAAMGLSELRSLRMSEMRIPILMALTFNGLAFVASVIELAAGRATPLAVLVGSASFAFTVGFAFGWRARTT